jgi:hypothetical protein
MVGGNTLGASPAEIRLSDLNATTSMAQAIEPEQTRFRGVRRDGLSVFESRALGRKQLDGHQQLQRTCVDLDPARKRQRIGDAGGCEPPDSAAHDTLDGRPGNPLDAGVAGKPATPCSSGAET